jgi:hypothetical protein
MIDYVTPSDRLNPQPAKLLPIEDDIAARRLRLELARAEAVKAAQARGKYLLDPGASWTPTDRVHTDIRQTFADAQTADMLAALEPAKLPALMQRQVA